jgi:hypothetical protein
MHVAEADPQQNTHGGLESVLQVSVDEDFCIQKRPVD